ncbi:3-oxoacyl-ACP synthase [Streptomyces palmae]|uniref:3-oxoacyl-ACP synthase n=1 Tax=Streptomyces palmae TaxID=1701085 RepID=A0A4Z0HJS3_9ACTN|nr:3-oxoacyl-ACP synthase [Streptomyces palmae]
MTSSAVITGVGLALPGVDSAKDLLSTVDPAPEPVDPAARIGKKGLRYKDRATQLGLVAAHDALIAAGLLDGHGLKTSLKVAPEEVAVVVSSNFGNLDSVVEVVDTIAKECSSRLVSPIVTPNLSSNIVASEVAIRYTLRGPNLTVCNGATGGLDAVGWALSWLRAGRARYVLVVGVEPDNPVVRKLVGGDRVLDGAAALVLERPADAAEREAPALAECVRAVRTSSVAACTAALTAGGERPAAWYLPEGGAEVDQELLPGADRLDLAPVFGTTSGALGVLQLASAAGRYQTGERGPVLAVCGAEDDGVAGVLIRPGQD